MCGRGYPHLYRIVQVASSLEALYTWPLELSDWPIDNSKVGGGGRRTLFFGGANHGPPLNAHTAPIATENGPGA